MSTPPKNSIPTVTVDSLLRQKREQSPSASAMHEFEQSFPRKLMAAVARPRHTGRALKVAGWLTPFVFGCVALVALLIAYFASPARAIARWEASATRKEYVVDNLSADVSSKPWKVDHGMENLSSEVPSNASPTANAGAVAAESANHF